jgi:hypothetical protein
VKNRFATSSGDDTGGVAALSIALGCGVAYETRPVLLCAAAIVALAGVLAPNLLVQRRPLAVADQEPVGAYGGATLP